MEHRKPRHGFRQRLWLYGAFAIAGILVSGLFAGLHAAGAAEPATMLDTQTETPSFTLDWSAISFADKCDDNQWRSDRLKITGTDVTATVTASCNVKTGNIPRPYAAGAPINLPQDGCEERYEERYDKYLCRIPASLRFTNSLANARERDNQETTSLTITFSSAVFLNDFTIFSLSCLTKEKDAVGADECRGSMQERGFRESVVVRFGPAGDKLVRQPIVRSVHRHRDETDTDRDETDTDNFVVEIGNQDQATQVIEGTAYRIEGSSIQIRGQKTGSDSIDKCMASGRARTECGYDLATFQSVLPVSVIEIEFRGSGSSPQEASYSILPLEFSLSDGPPPRSNLGGQVWYDQNADGIQDAGEPGLNDIAVNLYENADCSGEFAATTTTANGGDPASDGYYSFAGLDVGIYCVEFVVPDGMTVSPQDQGDGTNDSSGDTNGQITGISLTEDDPDQDLGLFARGTLGDSVMCVTTNEPIADIGVAVAEDFDCDGTADAAPFASTSTDDQGLYGFTDLEIALTGDPNNSTCYVVTVETTDPDLGDCNVPVDPTSYNPKLDTDNPDDPDSDFQFDRKPRPRVTLKKFTNGYDAPDPDGPDVPRIAPGQPVTWTYRVTNTGAITIPGAALTVTDSVIGLISRIVDKADGDDSLARGEQWIYQATGPAVDLTTPPDSPHLIPNVCTRNGAVAPPGTAYTNVGIVTLASGFIVTDTSSYCGPIVAGVELRKHTNGIHVAGPNDPALPRIAPDRPVRWTYIITNVGTVNVGLAQISVADSDPTVQPERDPLSDDGGDDVLSPGESWLYRASGLAVSGLYSNTGSVIVQSAVGPVSDADSSWYLGAVPPRIYLPSVSRYETDWGDAPASYGTESTWHRIVPGLSLGATVDAGPTARPSIAADADDLDPANGPDDEDGWVDAAPWITGMTPTLTLSVVNSTGLTATLAAWIDFDKSAGFSADEVQRVPVPSGRDPMTVAVPFTRQITYNPPAPDAPDWRYVRVRLSTDDSVAETGAAPDGEIEDYRVRVLQSSNPLTISIRVESPAGFMQTGERSVSWRKRDLAAADCQLPWTDGQCRVIRHEDVALMPPGQNRTEVESAKRTIRVTVQNNDATRAPRQEEEVMIQLTQGEWIEGCSQNLRRSQDHDADGGNERLDLELGRSMTDELGTVSWTYTSCGQKIERVQDAAAMHFPCLFKTDYRLPAAGYLFNDTAAFWTSTDERSETVRLLPWDTLVVWVDLNGDGKPDPALGEPVCGMMLP